MESVDIGTRLTTQFEIQVNGLADLINDLIIKLPL